jgi:hypothetical protein
VPSPATRQLPEATGQGTKDSARAGAVNLTSGNESGLKGAIDETQLLEHSRHGATAIGVGGLLAAVAITQTAPAYGGAAASPPLKIISAKKATVAVSSTIKKVLTLPSPRVIG